MSAVLTPTATPSPWRSALPLLVLLLAAILLLYRETGMAMAQIWWTSDTFAHAMLVPPISLWLVWRQRERLAALTPRAQPWVLLLLLGAAGLWLLADLLVVNAAAQFALVGMVILAVPAVLGFQVAGAILFPLLFLFFAVPFGEFMLPTLMNWTADFTVLGLRLTGVPVLRDGLQFVIPSGSWSVVEECSGVRYLIASFMVGSLFAYLNYRSWQRRALFMLVALAVPLVANWARAYIIVMLGHLSGNKIAAGVDHIIYGWVFFGFVIMIMFMIGARWSEPDEAPVAAGSTGGTAAFGTATPELARVNLVTGLAAAAIVLLPHLAAWGLQRAEGAAAEARVELPAQLAPGWVAEAAGPWTPAYLNPSATAARTYTGPAGTVGVYVAYYRGQGPDRKLVSGLNTLVGLNDRSWEQRGGGMREISAGGQTITLKTAEVIATRSKGADQSPHLVVWRVYWVDGRFVAGDVQAKVAGALARLKGRGDEGAALIVHADAGSVAASGAALQAFMQDNLAALGARLQQTRDAR
jgi:exosortase A